MSPLESDLRAGQSWAFDSAVTDSFDEMLERSIPEYATMRESVTLAASAFLTPGTSVLDLGCSRGEALASIAALPETDRISFVGLEISPPMVAAARARFEGDARVRIEERDLRRSIYGSTVVSSVILSVLTLMFVPVNYRLRLLRECRDILHEGGALILVEKTLGEGPVLDDVFAANYHAKKVLSGYSPDEVERKRLALEGVLVPMPGSFTEEMLRRSGFREVDTFWAAFSFRGWVAVK